MDFFALTDHHLREPSLRVIKFISSLPTDFRCYPGEEVHPPHTPAHIVSFGASASISEEYAEPKNAGEAPSASLARYRNEVAARMAELPVAPDFIRRTVAAFEWCFDRIRELGGVAIHCHPYWRPAQRFNMPERKQTLFSTCDELPNISQRGDKRLFRLKMFDEEGHVRMCL